MQRKINAILLTSSSLVFFGCQPQIGNINTANSSTNVSNVANTSNTNANFSGSSSTVEATEPNQYQAKVTLTLEALGEQQKASLPTMTAIVYRNGADRRMEFALPNGEKVIYLDTVGGNFLVLPARKQYAELKKESLGFEVRRLMMPEQIVDQIKRLQGVRRVGEETLNDRPVVRYAYSATANTQTKAGQVATESFLLIDKETGLPLRTETVSQSQSGSVQGYNGLRLVTEMTDIQTNSDTSVFAVPTDFAKIDPEQVKAQVNLIFSAVAALVGQTMLQQTRPTVSPSPAM